MGLKLCHNHLHIWQHSLNTYARSNTNAGAMNLSLKDVRCWGIAVWNALSTHTWVMEGNGLLCVDNKIIVFNSGHEHLSLDLIHPSQCGLSRIDPFSYRMLTLLSWQACSVVSFLFEYGLLISSSQIGQLISPLGLAPKNGTSLLMCTPLSRMFAWEWYLECNLAYTSQAPSLPSKP